MAVQEHVAELCEAVFSELERGVQVIVHHFSLNSLSLEIKEDLVDGAENLLEVSVLLEALFSEGEAVTVRIQKIVTCLEAVYKEELRSVGGWSLSMAVSRNIKCGNLVWVWKLVLRLRVIPRIVLTTDLSLFLHNQRRDHLETTW